MFIIGAVEGAWYYLKLYAPLIALVILAVSVALWVWEHKRRP